VIRELRQEGRTILYVSHRMEEIFALSDAITVFKDGRYVRTFTDMQQVNHDQLVQAMVGRELGDIYHWQPRSMALNACAWIASKRRACARRFRYPCAAVKSSACLVWWGGAQRIDERPVRRYPYYRWAGLYDGERVDIQKPAHAIRAGMMLCPEDRKAEGLFRCTRYATTSIFPPAVSLFAQAA
jgi:L-arabinose transport system ATP-binding protein